MKFFSKIRSIAGWQGASALLLLLTSSLCASAQLYQEPKGLGPANVKPAILEKIGIDQRLNEQLPLQTTFHNESGQTVRLGDYFNQKPVVLALVYYTCPMLCNEVLGGLTTSLRMLKFNAGEEFEVVAISINPNERPADALSKRAGYIQRYHRPGSEKGWHFLTGDEQAIQAVAKAAGFRYTWDPSIKQYAHASGIMVVTPQGKLAQYYYGIEYSPRDLRLGLVQASENKIGSLVDALLLYCYHYDPATGKYSAIVMRIVRLAGAATALGIGVLMLVLFRRERQRPVLVGLRRQDYKGIRS